MTEQSEEERIALRLAELKRRIHETEVTLTEMWLEMIDLRAKRAAVRKLTEQNGDAE
jgi:hypothetical protein